MENLKFSRKEREETVDESRDIAIEFIETRSVKVTGKNRSEIVKNIPEKLFEKGFHQKFKDKRSKVEDSVETPSKKL